MGQGSERGFVLEVLVSLIVVSGGVGGDFGRRRRCIVDFWGEMSVK